MGKGGWGRDLFCKRLIHADSSKTKVKLMYCTSKHTQYCVYSRSRPLMTFRAAPAPAPAAGNYRTNVFTFSMLDHGRNFIKFNLPF